MDRQEQTRILASHTDNAELKQLRDHFFGTPDEDATPERRRAEAPQRRSQPKAPTPTPAPSDDMAEFAAALFTPTALY